MKFLFFTDPHISGRNPKSRKDYFPDTILEKMNEVTSIANEVGATAVFDGGDLYENPDPASSIARTTCQIYCRFNMPVYSVFGNHTLHGQNPETFQRTTVGIIEGANLIKRLNIEKPTIIEESGITVGITGSDFNYDIDKGDRVAEYMPKKPDNVDILIHVVHGFLADKKWHEDIPHTLIDDILDTEADIILTGHEHKGYGIIKKNNKIFCNPGAIGRVSASTSEMERIPQVAIIDIKEKDDYDIHLRKISCAMPSEEVLDREELEKMVERKNHLSSFTNQVSFYDIKGLNPYEVIEKLAKEDDLDPSVIKETRNRMQKAEEDLSKNNNDDL